MDNNTKEINKLIGTVANTKNPKDTLMLLLSAASTTQGKLEKIMSDPNHPKPPLEIIILGLALEVAGLSEEDITATACALYLSKRALDKGDTELVGAYGELEFAAELISDNSDD